ncbi:hypothetical protein [Exiguobacterium sp. S22-S28]|uniref:hypothetical protein n=1 Tax=Exiguobacterium sp. S22-S28 TaxID=3342768 RepID=UPI00372D6826
MNEDEKMIITKEMDFGKSILGILDVLEEYDIGVEPSNAISLLRNRIFIEELLTKQGKELPGVPSAVRRALMILQSVMDDEKILAMCRTKTLHHLLLPDTGLLIADVRLMRDANLTYGDLEDMTLEIFQNALLGSRRPATYQRIMDAYRKFESKDDSASSAVLATTNIEPEPNREEALGDTEAMQKTVTKELEQAFREMTYDLLEDTFSLEDVMRETGSESFETSNLLEGMIRADLLTLTSDSRYKKRVRSLSSILSSEIQSHDLLQARLDEGLTMQEIAIRYGLDAKEVQRRLRQALNLIPLTHVKEARRYLQRFERFDIPERVFVEVFEEPAMVHRFLSEKVVAGTDDVRGLYGKLSERQRWRFKRSLSLIVTHEGDVVRVTRENLLEHVLWFYADQGARLMEGWKQLYDEYLEEEYKAVVAKKFESDSRKLSSIAFRSECIIQSAGKRHRFYDRSRLTQRRLQRLRGLLRLDSGFYGIQHLFELSPALMEELDCREPDELQYIVRRYVETTSISVVGNSEVAIGTLGKSMSLLTKREATWFSKRLTEEVYTYEELEEKFSHVEEFSSRYLNGGALEKVGFVNRGGLVLRAIHANAETYFQSILARDELFVVPDSPVFSSVPFRRVVKRMEEAHDLFRFDVGTYISIARLRKAGVNKGMVKALVREMIEAVKRSGEDYFTFASIQNDLASRSLNSGWRTSSSRDYSICRQESVPSGRCEGISSISAVTSER